MGPRWCFERKLTIEEMQVLQLVSYGQRRASIARTLGMPRARVDRRMRRLLDKLGADSRLEAVLFARDLGVLAPLEFYGS